jgi:hypothetical protein
MRAKSTLNDQQKDFVEFTEDLMLSPNLSEQDVAGVLRGLEKLGATYGNEIKAKYKIELTLEAKRRPDYQATAGIIQIWASGAKLHGDGDALLYQCPGKSLGVNECEQLLPEQVLGFSRVLCPHCCTTWSAEQIIDTTYYRLSMQNWSYAIVKWFQLCKLSADLRLKWMKQDIRKVTDLELARDRGGELLAKARSVDERPPVIYPLKNIIKDTSAGASLYSRILTFLKS